jgi:hypothetical protein
MAVLAAEVIQLVRLLLLTMVAVILLQHLHHKEMMVVLEILRTKLATPAVAVVEQVVLVRVTVQHWLILA